MEFYRDFARLHGKRSRGRSPPERAAMLDTGDGNYIEIFEDMDYHTRGPTAP